MSDFKFSCPNCSQSIVCDTSNAGMQIPCPSCQTLLTVPQPPPAAPAPPTGPIRLSINKTAHQPHAAPPASHAPKTPAPPAAPATRFAATAPKKKSPWIPIAIGCGVVALLAVGWFAFGAPYLKAQEEKKRQAEEEARRQAEMQAKAAAEAAKPKPKAVWKLDLADTKFPEHPASGKQHGTDFTVETALFQGGNLTLRQTAGSPRQFVIGLPLKPGEPLVGKTFEVTPTNKLNLPRVMLNWKEDSGKPPGMESFAKGYAMKLEFGNVTDGKLSGKIYLCVPDPEQSFVAGTFQIGPNNPSAQPAAGAPPANDPRQARRQQ